MKLWQTVKRYGIWLVPLVAGIGVVVALVAGDSIVVNAGMVNYYFERFDMQAEGWQDNPNARAYVNGAQARSNIEGDSAFVLGWAYIPTEHEVEDRQVYMVLSDGEKHYRAQATLAKREDVYREAMQHPGSKNTADLGFRVLWSSLLPLDDGIYRMGMYIRENDVDSGIVWTDTAYVLKNGVSKRYWGEKVGDIANTRVAYDIRHAVLAVWDEHIEDKKPGVKVIGLAYQLDQSTENQNVYVRLHNNDTGKQVTYKANTSTNQAVYAETGDARYAQCNFTAYVPIEEIGWGQVEITIILENGQMEGRKPLYLRPDYIYTIKLGLDVNYDAK